LEFLSNLGQKMKEILVILGATIIFVAIMEFALYKIWKNNNDR